MHPFSTLSVAVLVTTAQAFDTSSISTSFLKARDAVSTLFTKRAICPPVWKTISQDLTTMFRESNGQCNDDARAAIRITFHDCFPDGGCDASIALPDELARPENSSMTPTVNKLKALAARHGVSVADMIVFAGSHAVSTCPLGPPVRTLIGRTDATTVAPTGQLPAPNAAAADSISKFAAKGFSSKDLAALIGAHTTSKQFVIDPAQAGAPQDSTPGIFDILYFLQTITGRAPFTFEADTNLANSAEVGPFMRQFSVDAIGFNLAFSSAMAKMEMLGASNPATMADCTFALPRGLLRRDAKAQPVAARA